MIIKKDPTKTSLFDGRRVSKDSNIMWGVGTLDEANAFIGLAKVFVKDSEVRTVLEEIQKKLFRVGAELVSDSKISESDYKWLMETVKRFEDYVDKPNSFIILEKDESTAFLSVARTVIRRAERWAVTLSREGVVSPLLVEWLNKLNYLLYLMILKEGREFEKI
jgi:cob(I)alamin adenosyltransferase